MTALCDVAPTGAAPALAPLGAAPSDRPTESGAREGANAAQVTWNGSQAPQRAAMRALRDRLGDDPEALCLAYVEAERSGVPRTPGAEAMSPLLHARMLWREGKLNGWLAR